MIFKKPVNQNGPNRIVETPKASIATGYGPFGIETPTIHRIKRNISEFSRHRPVHLKILHSRQVQTDESDRGHLPLLGKPVAPPKLPQEPQHLPTTDSMASLGLKKQESSNFSMFKGKPFTDDPHIDPKAEISLLCQGMNSNDLYNYIDDVIDEFRAKTRVLTEEMNKPDKTASSIDEFTDTTTFYPDEHDVATFEVPKRSRKSDKTAPLDLSTIMSSEDDDEDEGNNHDEAVQHFVESRPFSNTTSNEVPPDGHDLDDDDESSTFINYTHSFEIDGSTGTDQDETLSNSTD